MYSEALQAFSCMTSGRDLESPIQDESIRTVFVAYDSFPVMRVDFSPDFSVCPFNKWPGRIGTKCLTV